jgi:arylsulfatase A-like enzyme
MNARQSLIFAFFAATVVGNAAFADHPNVVLFIADDVSWNDYGCYGSPTARTPNIDKLAAGGMRFTNAFLTASSCSPSRCSIVTGRYPHNNGGASELHRPLPWHLQKFPTLLREAGYYTAISGKDHMPQDKPPQGETTARVWDHKDGGRSKENSGGHANWVQVTRDRPKDKPFFFWFAAYDAHRGWDGDKQWQPSFGEKHQPGSVDVPQFLIDDQNTRDDLTSYHNEVTRFDYFIGQTIDELDRQGELNNTLIFVLADNGRPFPRAKTRLHDSGIKTALVAHWPEGIDASGEVCSSLVSTIDLAPTVLQAADIDVPETMQGVSLLPVFANSKATVRRYAFSEHNWHDYEAFGRSVRGDGYLYIINRRPYAAWQGPADSVNSPSHTSLLKRQKSGSLTLAQQDVFLSPRPAIELYDVAADPHQLRNLAGKPAHAEVQLKLAKLMQQWQETTGDTVPKKLTPDTFDRTTGTRIVKGTPRGTAPGSEKNADRINNSGPR